MLTMSYFKKIYTIFAENINFKPCTPGIFIHLKANVFFDIWRISKKKAKCPKEIKY